MVPCPTICLSRVQDYLKVNEDVFERALAAIGEISPDVAYYEAAARGQEWPQVLLHRKRLRADPTPAESRLYADRVNNDRRRVQNKFFPAKVQPAKQMHVLHFFLYSELPINCFLCCRRARSNTAATSGKTLSARSCSPR